MWIYNAYHLGYKIYRTVAQNYISHIFKISPSLEKDVMYIFQDTFLSMLLLITWLQQEKKTSEFEEET